MKHEKLFSLTLKASFTFSFFFHQKKSQLFIRFYNFFPYNIFIKILIFLNFPLFFNFSFNPKIFCIFPQFSNFWAFQFFFQNQSLNFF